MNRPTKGQVDDSLAIVEHGDLLDRSPAARVLAAEVRALREELGNPEVHTLANEITKAVIDNMREENKRLREELEQHKKWAGDRNYCDSCGKSILNIVTANATIARVEALCVEYEGRNGDRELCWMTADTFRAALRGES
jgi:hypothetical protein